MRHVRSDRQGRQPARRPRGHRHRRQRRQDRRGRAELAGDAGARDRRHRPPGVAALRRLPFPHGRDAVARPAAPQPLRHAAGRHRALGRAEAAPHPRGGDRAGARAIATSRWRRACSPSAAMSTSATTGCSPSRRCSRCRKKVAPYLDLQLVAFPQDGFYRSPNAATNLARALDLGVDVVGGIPHFERTMADGAALVTRALRDRRRARPAGRHALRRDRRSAVAPHRDAGLRDAAPRAAGPGRRLASHLDAFDGQLLRLEADPADRRGRRPRHRQPADQHHAPGPPRHLSEAPRHDAGAGAARRRHQRRLRP